jgi:hypothetical protein
MFARITEDCDTAAQHPEGYLRRGYKSNFVLVFNFVFFEQFIKSGTGKAGNSTGFFNIGSAQGH